MLNRLYTWYGKRTVRLVLGVIVVLILGILLTGKPEQENIVSKPQLKTVFVSPIKSLNSDNTIELVGTVESQNEARIESEVSKRVTGVSVSLGQTIERGALIATLENASERAALLQAEGAYEATLAGAAQSDVSEGDARNALVTAENNARTTYRGAFTTLDTIIKNDIDQLFSDTTDTNIGIRIDADNNQQQLIGKRVSIKELLNNWSRSLTVTDTDVLNDLNTAKIYTQEIAALIEGLSNPVFDAKNDNITIGGGTMDTFRLTFTSNRSSVNTVLQNLDNAIVSVESARDNLERAAIGGTGTELSLANAQVKQALGRLRAAEAELAKTIIRTPVSGTVNSVSVRTGDFVGVRSPIALISNNNALLITTFVGEQDRTAVEVGRSVTIEGTEVGIITAIAPAVDPVTKKIKVEIQTENALLNNGDTVRISLTAPDTVVNVKQKIMVPLTAVKFSAADGNLFTVEDGIIRKHPVSLGDITGSSVEVLDGIDYNSVIVTDARGLTEGEEVEPVLE